ncbi:MAG: dihydroorotate dehydrogenase [Candidatus Brocadiales bacterium]|nr:dihydroorotate dehydrogenase [Candidatus Bathyanammoxibius amoris]
MAAVDISTEISGIALRNPTVLASGILGTSNALLQTVAGAGAGAVTTKSISLDPMPGHNNPVTVGFEAGLLNAVGYANPGLHAAAQEFSNPGAVGVPVIASVIGRGVGDIVKVVEGLWSQGFAAIEISLSCPHTPGFGAMAGQNTPSYVRQVVSAARRVTSIPLFVKLSADTADIAKVAKAAEEAGADGITATNTIGPGMIINIEARRPVLGFKKGGISGPALRPIAVRCVYDIYEAVRIPIIGTGGVSAGRHAIEMLMAGASAVGIGTAVCTGGVGVFSTVCGEMEDWMVKNGYSSVKELIGAAHESGTE